jgi:ABC-type branched-subunit amino acid transport system ATPase component
LANNIVVKDVNAGYGSVKVLHGVSMEVRDGETVALLGTNGNGKSTLLKCIMGMVTPDSGEIYLESDGERVDLVGKAPEEIVNLGITLVPEGRRLFPMLTVEENLELGAYRPDARNGLDANKQFCFEAFPVLEERRHQRAGSMSGGEQQMLAIARSLMSSPKVLLVDEPNQRAEGGVQPDGPDGRAEFQSSHQDRRSGLHHRGRENCIRREKHPGAERKRIGQKVLFGDLAGLANPDFSSLRDPRDPNFTG